MSHIQIIVIILVLFAFEMEGQTVFDNQIAVQIQAEARTNPPGIILTWVNDTTNLGYTLYRKEKNDLAWGDTLVVLDSTITTWTDTNVQIGDAYEYRILKSQPKFPLYEAPTPGTGYIYAGIQVPPTHHRGRCLVVIDSTFNLSLQPEIQRLLMDLEMDGWNPASLYVSPAATPPVVKDMIRSWAIQDSQANEAIFLLGHVPVPYSGDIAPDGHPEHLGAWPCDGYYAELDSVWTDSIVTVNLSNSRNGNKPGDGKFDNRRFPGPVRLQVGRVDFSQMDKLLLSEEELLRRYLNKDHNWRTGQMPVVERGLIDNNIQKFEEGLGQVPWKTFAPMFGLDQVKEVPYRSTLMNESWLWSYGCGGGGPESASDISSTTLMATDSLQTVFTMLFGSYFGDWDQPNDFLRAAIGSAGSTLISTWGNRPNWVFHHMALGEHTGLASQLTMNDYSLYFTTYSRRFVHIGLMGDPTLRMHILPPVQNLTLSRDGLQIHLDWEDPNGAIGYFIYKKTDPDQPFALLTTDPLTELFFTDPCVEEGWVRYMVRGVELRSSGSGTYYNLSSGLAAEITAEPWDLHPSSTPSAPGQSTGTATVDPEGGCLPHSFQWSQGSLTASISGLDPGAYCVTVTDCLGCSAQTCVDVDMSNPLVELDNLISFKLYPNPTQDHITLDLVFSDYRDVRLRLLSIQGQILSDQIFQSDKIHHQWDVGHLATGTYWLQIETSGQHATTIWIKE